MKTLEVNGVGGKVFAGTKSFYQQSRAWFKVAWNVNGCFNVNNRYTPSPLQWVGNSAIKVEWGLCCT